MPNRRVFLLHSFVATVAMGSPSWAEEEFNVRLSDVQAVPYKFRRREVKFESNEPAGTIVVDSQRHFLFFVNGDGTAIRYGIGVGKSGKRWTGEAIVGRKARWPKWTPTDEMVQRHENYAKWAEGMPGGTDNPLGARAIYLLNDGKDNQFRIHGTPLPDTIGKDTTSGCFRMLNVDVIDLYERVDKGTRVVVMPRVASKRQSLFGSIE